MTLPASGPDSGPEPERQRAVPYLSNPDPVDGRARPIAFAHRGFSTRRAENSAAAFQEAVKLGYGWVETDAHTTCDGVAMAFHDDSLDRVTDGSGPISAHTRAQLRHVMIEGREPIPLLEELLIAWPHVRFNIDIKDDGSIKSVARLIDRLDAADRVCIASFSDARRRAVQRRLRAGGRKVRVAGSAGRVAAGAVYTAARIGVDAVARPFLRGVDCLQVPQTLRGVDVITDKFIATAHRLGLAVHVWTINDEPTMIRLLQMGVDGIMTDRADLLASVMGRRGLWPQDDAAI